MTGFFNKEPDDDFPCDLRRFQIEQQADGVPAPTMNSIVSALHFLFIQTLDRPAGRADTFGCRTRAEAQRSRLFPSNPAHSGAGGTGTDIGRGSKPP